MRVLTTLAVALLLAGAGCFDSGNKDDTGKKGKDSTSGLVMPEDPMPEGSDHSHGASQHKFLWNYNVTAHDALNSNPVNVAGLHVLGMADGHLFGAAWGSHAAATDGGLAIWDLSDPAVPSRTAFLPFPGAVGGDRSLGVAPSGDFVVLAMEDLTCFGQVNPAGAAVLAYLIDTTDKSDPQIVDVITTSGTSAGSPTNVAVRQGGFHSVWAFESDGEEYASLFGELYHIEKNGTAGFEFVDTGVSMNVGHDLYVRDTPWGTKWALVANGMQNLVIYDITDPFAPVEIGNWEHPERGPVLPESTPVVNPPAYIKHYYHTADVAFFDDQIIVVLTSEDVGNHTSPFWILDATMLRGVTGDADAPAILDHIGTWENPGGHEAGETTFSQHNPRFTPDGIFTLSHYHGGVWQFDFRHERASPTVIAYATYAADTVPIINDPQQATLAGGLCGIDAEIENPMVMDVEVGPTGIIYAADTSSGLYTFTPTADHPVYGAMNSR